MLPKLKRKRTYLNQIYKENPETHALIIEVSLDNYNEVFNGWDPSPIKRRDLDPDLLQFIEQCAFDIPLKHQVELHFYLPKEQFDENKEQLTKAGVKNNFNFIIHFIKKELMSNHRKMVIYMIMSFTFLLSHFILKQQVTIPILSNTLVEGLFIGGWVFLWESFSLFFFSGQEPRSRLKRYYRFNDTPINFYYL